MAQQMNKHGHDPQPAYRILILGTLPAEVGSRNYGGVARVVWSLAQSLAETETSFAVGGLGKYYGGDQTLNGVHIYGFKFDLGAALKTVAVFARHTSVFFRRSAKNTLRLLHAVYFLSRLSRRIKFDCINVHHVHNQVPLAAKLLKLKVPVFATVHSYDDIVGDTDQIRDREALSNYNEQLQLADHISHVSSSLRDRARTWDVIWSCPDEVIHNGVDFPVDSFADFDSMPRQAGQVCFSGSLIERKGIWRLLDAIAIAKQDVKKLVVTGNGPLREAVEARIAAREIDADLLSYLPSQRMVFEKMAASDVFVVPSISESFGLVYLEALLAGTPVIGFHHTIEEFRTMLRCTATESDWLVPYNHDHEDAQDLANKIRQALQVKQRHTYTAERDDLREKIIEHFGWAQISRRYQAIYHICLDRAQHGGS